MENTNSNEKSLTGLQLKYFVLKPKGIDAYAEASREAMLCYAENIENHNPQLAKELRKWVKKEKPNLYCPDDNRGTRCP